MMTFLVSLMTNEAKNILGNGGQCLVCDGPEIKEMREEGTREDAG